MTTQNFDKIAAFGQETVDAFVQSGTLAVKGLEELAKAYTALANLSIEQTTSAVKALSTVKSPTEFQTVYTTLAKTGFETAVVETRKIQELTNSIVTTSVAPLNARAQAVASLFKAA